MRTFIERKKLAHDILTSKLVELHPGLEKVENLSSQAQSEINQAAFTLSQVMGRVQSEVVDLDNASES